MQLLVVLSEVFRADGGIPMFNRALLRALSDFCGQYGADATVLVLNDATAELEPRYLAPSSIRFRGCQRNKVAFVSRFLGAALAGADLTIIGHVNLLPLAGVLALLGRPYFLIAHGIEAWQKLPRFSRCALRRARSVLAVSNYTRQRLSRENGIPADCWRVFPNTLDPFLTPAPARRAPQPTLLSVARLDSQERGKGIESVLDILPGLRAQFPALHYVVVGRGDDQPRLQERARVLGLQNCIRFAGYLSPTDLARQYAACDVFVLPSIQEGFGIVFLEAMAHAKPVVGIRAGGTPEVITHAETGLLVDPGDRDALAAALSQLLSGTDLRQQIGAAGYRRLHEHFDFEHFRARLTRILVEELPSASYLSRRNRKLSQLPREFAERSLARPGHHGSLSRRNRDWWEKNPMSYDWRHPRFLREGTPEYFDDIDRRLFAAAFFAQPEGGTPFSDLIDFSSLAGKDVLEVGCGLGSHAELLSRAGCHLYAVDITRRATRLSRQRLRSRPLPGSVVQADGEVLPFVDQSFDFVWSWGVLHHFPESESAIQEILRVLRPGGRVSLMVYYHHSLVHWINIILVRGILMGQLLFHSLPDLRRKYSDGLLVRFYRRQELTTLLASACVEIETRVFGQLTELLPLPRRLRDPLVRFIPRPWSQAILRRWGSFLWVTARKAGAKKGGLVQRSPLGSNSVLEHL